MQVLTTFDRFTLSGCEVNRLSRLLASPDSFIYLTSLIDNLTHKK